MTYRELYSYCVDKLKNSDIENAGFDAQVIFEEATGLKKADVFIKSGDKTAQEEETALSRLMLEKRISGEPLQYIIGVWEFMGLEFFVGEGVLIPRPETEGLVEFAVDFINQNKKNAVVYDLCSGSGCIGLSVARYCKDASVIMLEKSNEAFSFLEKNMKKHNLKNARAVKGDVFDGIGAFELPAPDLILSNPPYIKSDEIPLLQTEVQKEPHMALDGGESGLIFYECLAEKWLKLTHKTVMAVECGENQAKLIEDMFKAVCTQTRILKDLSGTERIVIAEKA